MLGYKYFFSLIIPLFLYFYKRVFDFWIYIVISIIGYIWGTLFLSFRVLSSVGYIWQVTENHIVIQDKLQRRELFYDKKKFSFQVGEKLYYAYANNKIVKVYGQYKGVNESSYRQSCIKFLQDFQYGDILASITLGIKPSNGEICEYFKKAGIFHLLVISGFHFSLILGFITYLLRKLLALSFYINYSYSSFSIMTIGRILLGILYLFFITPSFAATRAFITILLGNRNLPYIGLIILILWPNALFSYGFIFSMLATYGITQPLRELHIAILLLPFLQSISWISLLMNLVAMRLFTYLIPLSLVAVLCQLSFLTALLNIILGLWCDFLKLVVFHQQELLISQYLYYFYIGCILVGIACQEWKWIYGVAIITLLIQLLQ